MKLGRKFSSQIISIQKKLNDSFFSVKSAKFTSNFEEITYSYVNLVYPESEINLQMYPLPMGQLNFVRLIWQSVHKFAKIIGSNSLYFMTSSFLVWTINRRILTIVEFPWFGSFPRTVLIKKTHDPENLTISNQIFII